MGNRLSRGQSIRISPAVSNNAPIVVQNPHLNLSSLEPNNSSANWTPLTSDIFIPHSTSVASLDGQNSDESLDGKESEASLDGKNSEASLDGQIPEASLDGQNPEAGLDGQNPEASLDGQNPEANLDGQNPEPSLEDGQNLEASLDRLNSYSSFDGQNYSGIPDSFLDNANTIWTNPNLTSGPELQNSVTDLNNSKSVPELPFQKSTSDLNHENCDTNFNFDNSADIPIPSVKSDTNTNIQDSAPDISNNNDSLSQIDESEEKVFSEDLRIIEIETKDVELDNTELIHRSTSELLPHNSTSTDYFPSDKILEEMEEYNAGLVDSFTDLRCYVDRHSNDMDQEELIEWAQELNIEVNADSDRDQIKNQIHDKLIIETLTGVESEIETGISPNNFAPAIMTMNASELLEDISGNFLNSTENGSGELQPIPSITQQVAENNKRKGTEDGTEIESKRLALDWVESINNERMDLN